LPGRFFATPVSRVVLTGRRQAVFYVQGALEKLIFTKVKRKYHKHPSYLPNRTTT